MQHRGATPSTGTSTLYAYAWTHKAQQTGADGMTSALHREKNMPILVAI